MFGAGCHGERARPVHLGGFCGAHSCHSKAQEQSKHSLGEFVGSSDDNIDKLNVMVQLSPKFLALGEEWWWWGVQ